MKHNHTFSLELLTIVFVTLKLIGKIDWSWWWILSPIWIFLALFIIIFLLILSYGIIRSIFS